MKKLTLIILLFPVLIFTQDLAPYYKLLERGKIEYVRSRVVELRKQNPQSPDILYLSGIVEPDGEKALLIFKDVLSQYPNSSRADDALLKIIEYIYTKGLYRRAIKYSKGMIRKYPESELLPKCVNVILCSFSAVNSRDSVDYYYGYFRELYPDMLFDFQDYQYSSTYLILEKGTSGQTIAEQKNSVKTVQAKPEESKPQISGGNFAIQLGAFANSSNAYFLKNKLKTKGYESYIHRIVGSKRTLLSVRIGHFHNSAQAKSFGDELKRKDKLEYIVVKNK